MNPETQQPSYTQYPGAPQQVAPAPQLPDGAQRGGPKKTVSLIVAVILILLIGGAVFWLLGFGKKTTDQADKTVPTGTSVSIGNADKPVTYMGNQMYDACNFLPVDLIKKHVGEYEKTFNNLGGKNFLKEPLGVEHTYYDRDLSAILGKDGTAREPGTAISEKGIDTNVRLQSFASLGDSNCLYGQGDSFKTRLAQVYVIQPPKPLHPKLLDRFAELKAKGLMPGTEQGVEIYVEEVKEGDSTIFTALRKGNVVVFLSTVNRELMEALLVPSIQRLNQAPAGNMTVTYPSPYSKLTNACNLLSADDFGRLFGKPSDALVNETLYLTESEPKTALRQCQRIEVERLKEGEISSVTMGLSESRTEQQTKDRLSAIKTDKDKNEVKKLDKLGDEAYVVSTGILDKDHHKILIRSGKVILSIESNGEKKDTSVDAWVSRNLPIAQKILANYKK